jgi:hypothetical protein
MEHCAGGRHETSLFMGSLVHSPSIEASFSGEVYKLQVVEKLGEISLQTNPSYPCGNIYVAQLRLVLVFQVETGEIK